MTIDDLENKLNSQNLTNKFIFIIQDLNKNII